MDVQELRLDEHDRQRPLLQVRLLAALRAARPAVFALLAAALILTLEPGTSFGADPTTAPARPPSCAERYPEEGPAALDLRLGCVIGEVVDQYTGSVGDDPTPASTYALVVVGILVVGFIAIWLVGRAIRGAAGRRLAPVRPDEWWLCEMCHSVNGAAVAHCYSCGARRPDGPNPTLRTDDAPSTTQSFGSTRKRG